MAKKMCPKWDEECGGENRTRGRKGCPRNANSRCEIVKPKAKMVRVKAWADVSKEGIHKGILFGAFPYDKMTSNDPIEDGYTPCFILIDEKWLKEKK